MLEGAASVHKVSVLCTWEGHASIRRSELSSYMLDHSLSAGLPNRYQAHTALCHSVSQFWCLPVCPPVCLCVCLSHLLCNCLQVCCQGQEDQEQTCAEPQQDGSPEAGGGDAAQANPRVSGMCIADILAHTSLQRWQSQFTVS